MAILIGEPVGFGSSELLEALLEIKKAVRFVAGEVGGAPTAFESNYCWSLLVKSILKRIESRIQFGLSRLCPGLTTTKRHAI